MSHVQRAAEVLAGRTPIGQHSEACPVWVGRTVPVPISDCQCSVLKDAVNAVEALVIADLRKDLDSE